MSLLYYVLAFLIGAIVGTQVNRGIYRFAWDARLISPWSPRHPDASERVVADRIPIFGWWSLRRDAEIHGRGFWLRPMLIELLLGFGFAFVFWYVVQETALVPEFAGAAVIPWHSWVWCGWFLFLISLMAIATFIDFDERTIPDEITVPGTLIGLILMTLVPVARLPEAKIKMAVWDITPLHIGSPNPLPGWVFAPESLVIVLACFLVWCFALLPIMWTTRKGARGLFKFAWASLRRPRRAAKSKIEIKPRSMHAWTWAVIGMAIVGSICIVTVWSMRIGWSSHWEGLVSSMLGLAFGGGIVWWIRIIGYIAMRREAMGFGDVTLMAMIGAFVGWQPSLMIFLFAPVVALAVVFLQLIFSRDNEIAFGPYLCASALVIMMFWSGIWNDWAAKGVFTMTAVLLPVLTAGLLLAAPLLWVMSLIKTKLLGYTD